MHNSKNTCVKLLFSQIELSPEDKTYGCSNYDEADMLKSFQDCEDQYFKKSLPEGLIPPWIVPLSNLNVATSIWHHNDNKSKFMGDLWRTFGNLYLFKPRRGFSKNPG